MNDIEIEVDGLPVLVYEKFYLADPGAVVDQVRAARAEVVGDLSQIHEISPDFDELEARYASE